MRVIIQRVSSASVRVDDKVTGKIEKGLLIFVGFEEDDEANDIDWLTSKIINLRIFRDDQDKMNLALKEVKGELLVVSQFTLHASTKKGNRPSFIRAANPDKALKLYEEFKRKLAEESGTKIQSGIFAADMKVELVNDGPVTIWMDSKNRE